MNASEKIKSELVRKIMSIRNSEILNALNQLISSGNFEDEPLQLTSEQISILELSEKDLLNGDVISQEAMDKKNLEWLNGK